MFKFLKIRKKISSILCTNHVGKIVLCRTILCYSRFIANMGDQHLIHSQSVPVLQNHGVKKLWTRSHSDNEWKDAWKEAVLKAKNAGDPWDKYKIDESCKLEKALRYRYNALLQKWVRDEIQVKMQDKVHHHHHHHDFKQMLLLLLC